jgi:hypothetical protein
VALLLAAAALVVWTGVAVAATAAEAADRAELTAQGERTVARVVEEGLARPGGGWAQAWVQTPAGRRPFVDLTSSGTRVTKLGQELAVVLPGPGAADDVGLPADVVDTPAVRLWPGRLALPVGLLVVAAAGALTRRGARVTRR